MFDSFPQMVLHNLTTRANVETVLSNWVQGRLETAPESDGVAAELRVLAGRSKVVSTFSRRAATGKPKGTLSGSSGSASHMTPTPIVLPLTSLDASLFSEPSIFVTRGIENTHYKDAIVQQRHNGVEHGDAMPFLTGPDYAADSAFDPIPMDVSNFFTMLDSPDACECVILEGSRLKLSPQMTSASGLHEKAVYIHI